MAIRQAQSNLFDVFAREIVYHLCHSLLQLPMQYDMVISANIATNLSSTLSLTGMLFVKSLANG